MATFRSFIGLLTGAIALSANAHPHHFKHEAVALERRQAALSVEPTPASPTPPPVTSSEEPQILTYLTPSPGASPIAITQQSQLETSFVPQYTLCALPPQAIFPLTPLPTMSTMSTPWSNYSTSIPPGNGSCTTIYSPTQTMVCATTLTGLVEKYTVSKCDQDITFSTEHGFVLARPTAVEPISSSALATIPTITPAPTVQVLTTYYLAPWQAVTAGIAPSDVDLKVCALYTNGTEECIHQYEVWHTSLITESATRTSSVNISTTLHGTSQVVVETYIANITEQITTFRLTTDMEFEYATEILTTSRETATPVTAPTNYVTMTLEEASSASATDLTTTRFSTIRTTRYTTVYVGTSTSTLPEIDVATPAPAVDQPLQTPTEPVDWASHLGIQTAKKH